jgi:D-alanyl-D-alanine dipeptidase
MHCYTLRGHNLRFCAASGGRAASLPIACSGLALRRDRRLASHPARLAQKRKLWPRKVYAFLDAYTHADYDLWNKSRKTSKCLAKENMPSSFDSIASNFVELRESDGLLIDLRYATSNNFVGENLYGEFNKAFLHKVAAEKLAKAVEGLHNVNPKYRFIIFDALRPRSVQHMLWNKVKGTDHEQYIANPESGSVHNFGFAVDLSVLDASGKELDMGTGFDSFTPLSQPRLEEKFIQEGILSAEQMKNRRLLKKLMEDVGFIQLPTEWWHFDALPKSEVKAKYKIVE